MLLLLARQNMDPSKTIKIWIVLETCLLKLACTDGNLKRPPRVLITTEGQKGVLTCITSTKGLGLISPFSLRRRLSIV